MPGFMYFVFLMPLMVLLLIHRKRKGSNIYIGFFRSCLSAPGTDRVCGNIPSKANWVASSYIRNVYGFGYAPAWKRKALAITTITCAFFCYSFIIANIMRAPFWLFITLFGLFFSTLILSGSLLLACIRSTPAHVGIASSRQMAIAELNQLEKSADWPVICDALRTVCAQPPIFWPYHLDFGGAFLSFAVILLAAIPTASFAYHLIDSGLHSHAMTVMGTILSSLGLALEWLAVIPALTWWGRWDGARLSTVETFPLRVLSQDVGDLPR
jgi:hypothetical protein